jgi:hypothetical protein
MTNTDTPILLTSSVIAHDKGVRLLDPGERKRLALESIHWWRSIAPSNPLVLCDGSDFDFQDSLATLADSGPVECLHFQNDVEGVKRQGRGFGEGEIVRHAIEHSSLIQGAGHFAKCTSKLWVENFDICMKQWNGNLLMKAVFNNVFSMRKPITLAYIDTRFYVMDVATYRKHFLHAHESINPEDGFSLEESFLEIIQKNQLQGCLMSPPPIICGVGGGTGAYYKTGLLRQLKEELRYHRLKINPLYRNWFARPQQEMQCE